MDRRLAHFLRIIGRHGHYLFTIVIPAKSDPNAVSMPCNCIHLISNANTVEEFGSIDTNANTGSDLCVLRCLLVDINGDIESFAVVMELQGGAEATNATTHDGDAERALFMGSHCST